MRYKVLLQPLPGPAHQRPAHRALTAAARPPAWRPRLQTRLIVPRGHPGQQLLHHPRAQRIARAERGHRRQGRLLPVPAAHAGPAHLQPAPAEGKLRRRRAPVMMCAGRLVLALRPGQRHGLLRGTACPARPARAHAPTPAGAAGWPSSRPASAPPGRPAPHWPHSPPCLRPVSLCSLLYWRLLGPRCWGPLSWPTSILRPTREPSLLSSQVQHGPGHRRIKARCQGARRPCVTHAAQWKARLGWYSFSRSRAGPPPSDRTKARGLLALQLQPPP